MKTRVAQFQRILQSAVLCAAVLLTLPAPAADQNDAHFDTFYAAFKSAVAQKDEAGLRKLMAPDFNFIRGTNVSWDKVFEGLAADNGRQWANLQQAVKGEPVVVETKDPQPPTRVVRCTPTDVIYNCLVVFTQERSGNWKWQGMIMPPRTSPPFAFARH
jgi:hypothetical protein